jgi:predicted acetyltransferase
MAEAGILHGDFRVELIRGRIVVEIRLVKPSFAELPGYVTALRTGWSPDNVRRAEAAGEHLKRIAADAARFLESLDDQDAKGEPVRLPDGSFARRLPGFTRWIWDGEFCGSIGFRWQRGSNALPPHVLGHIGFAVVPWKRGAGYAKQALALMLPEARTHGLTYVDLTTDPTNFASQGVIVACGGRLLERFMKPAAYGAAEGLRFRIELANAGDADQDQARQRV